MNNSPRRIPEPETRKNVVKLYSNALGDGFLLNRLRLWFKTENPLDWQEWFPRELGNSSLAAFDGNCRELGVPRRFHKWLAQSSIAMRRFLSVSIVSHEERHLMGMLGACHYLKSEELGVQTRVDKRPGIQTFCYAAIVCGIDEVRKNLVEKKDRFERAVVEIQSRRSNIDDEVRALMLLTHYRIHSETPLAPFSDRRLAENALHWKSAINRFRLILQDDQIKAIGRL